MRTSSVLLLLLASLALTACPEDAAEPAPLVIETTLGANTTVAGVPVTVSCAALRGGTPDGGVTTEIRLTPADGISLADGALTATRAGTYEVACAGGEVVDETPATLTVTAGPAAAVNVAVEPAQSAAGTPAQVTCEVVDDLGNALPDFHGAARVVPDDGVTVDGQTITGSLAGDYEVSCDFAPATDLPAATAAWSVVPAAPEKLVLALSPAKPAYRTDDVITVVAHSFDAFGNKVAGEVSIDALSVSPEAPTTGEPPEITVKAGGTYALTATSGDVSGATNLIIDALAPEVVANGPERGTTKDQEPLLLVNGVAADEHGLSEVRVNGELALVDENTGGFSHDWDLGYGLSLLHLAATDQAGNVGETWRSAGWSSAWYPMDPEDFAASTVVGGLQIVLTQAVLDDGDHGTADIDDVATLVETVLSGLDFGTLVPDPLGSFLGCDYHLQELSLDGAGVSLSLQDGYLRIDVTLHDFVLKVSNSGGFACSFHDGKESGDPWGGTGPLKYTADALLVEARLTFTTSGGVLKPSIEITSIDSDGTYNVNIPVIDDIVDGFFNFFLNIFKGLVANQLNALFGDLIASFALDLPLELPAIGAGEPTALRIKARPTSGSISKQALRLGLDALAHAESPKRPHDILGSLSYAGCGETMPVDAPDSAMTLALHDDVLNQLLFAVWDGGLLNQVLGADALGDFDVTQFGITGLSVQLDARLPLVLNTCLDEDVLQIGDLYVEASFVMGETPTTIALWVQGGVPVSLSVVENEAGAKEVAFALGDLDDLVLEIEKNEGFFEGNDEALIIIAKEQLLPQMLGSLTDGLGSFPLPDVDLSTLAEGLPEGAVLSIDVDSIVTGGGHIRVNAGL